MDFAEAVIQRLLGASGVTDRAGQRVQWTRRDQGGALPALVLTRISRFEENSLTLDDDLGEWVESIVRIDAYGKSHAETAALARAAIAALRPAAAVGGIAFDEAEADGPIDLGEDTPQGFVHRLSTDMTLKHNEEPV